MRRRSAVARPGQGERPGGRVTRGRGAGWAVLLGVLVVVLGAATAIAQQYDSLRWLLWLIVAVDALAGVSAVLLTSSWWQQRRDDRARQVEVGARRARQRARDQRDHFEPRGRGVLPRGGRRGWYFTGRTRALQELAGWLAARREVSQRYKW